jgi:hypothetical protein
MAHNDDNTIPLTASCLCKSHTYTTTIPISSLPLQGHICHCSSCRHITGSLYSSSTFWPGPAAIDLSGLKRFSFSEKVDALFCGTCSSPMFFVFDGKVGVLTGVLSNVDVEELIRFGGLGFVKDTLDGGASEWLVHVNKGGVPLKRSERANWGDDAGLVEEDWPPVDKLAGYEGKTAEDVIPIRCKCSGVDLLLHCGDYEGMKEADLPWNIDPMTNKLLAEFCACDSCRLQAGVDVFYWTFAEMKNISFPTGTISKSFPTHMNDLNALIDGKDPAIGTLSYYNSSPNVHRYFCSECSACIFFAKGERPTFADVAVGVLEASDGARAEGILSWTYGARLDYQEDGDGGWREGLYERVRKGAEEYRVSRGYAKNWKRVKKDKEEGVSG